MTRRVIFMIFLLALPAGISAESAGKLVSKGNGSFQSGDMEKAVEYYEKASVRLPESPVIAFNLGDVFFRQGDFAKARSYFEDAALKSKDLSLEAKAWYNTGNCAFSEGARQLDSDLEKALESYRESVGFYGVALEKDPQLIDAAHNMEIARIVIKDLLDRIQKQKEQMQQQQEKLKEVVDSLLAAMEDQEKALDRSLELDDMNSRVLPQWDENLDQTRGDQQLVQGSTEDVRDKLDELFPEQKPEQVEQASSHLDSAIVDQEEAGGRLEKKDPGGGAASQENALDQMKKALEKLTDGGDQNKGQQEQQDNKDQQQQQEQQQDQNQQQKKQQRSETARGIIEEEKENRKKRKQKASGGYKKVDKDW